MSPHHPSFAPELPLNTRFTLGAHTFTEEEILTFARAYDPQPFHIDAEAAKRSHFGGLVASGWHTAAMWMRYSIDWQTRRRAEAQARGESVPAAGAGLGFRDLRWLKPVYAGDIITFHTEIRERRPTKGRPGWSLISAYNSATNQHDDLVLDFILSELQGTQPG